MTNRTPIHTAARVYHLGAAALAQPLPPFYEALARLSRLMLARPAFEKLRPLARRLSGSLQPAGRLVHLLHPPRVSHPAHVPAQPGAVRAMPVSPDRNGLVILSANLCHDYPLHRRQVERLEAFARLVEAAQADILLLQEVSRTPRLHVDDWLARRLDMAYLYARANGDEPTIGFEEGLAVFSRYPVARPHLVELGASTSPFVRRLTLGAHIQLPGGDLPVYSVHLGIGSRQNARQLAHLVEWVQQQTGGSSAVIGGDFNTPHANSQIFQANNDWLDAYRQVHPHSRGDTHALGHTFTVGKPGWLALRRRRLDYIFVQPGRSALGVGWAEHIPGKGRSFSDHQAVVVRLQDAGHLNLQIFSN